MFNLSNVKYKNLLQNHSEYIYSINFKQLPKQIKSRIEDFEELAKLPYVRGMQEQRALYVNKACPEWQELIKCFVALDSLPDAVLYDMYKNYRQKYKRLTADQLLTFNEDETARRTIYSLLLEVMWTHGDDTVQSLIYPKI